MERGHHDNETIFHVIFKKRTVVRSDQTFTLQEKMKFLMAWAFQALFSSGVSSQQTRLVFQFPKPTWLENIAATRSGHLLTGVLGASPASLHVVDPSVESNLTQRTLLHTFPEANSVFGISEYAPDLFAVAIGNYSPSTGSTKGTYSVWSVDVRHLSSCANSSIGPLVHKIADVPNMEVINGIAALNDDAILLADSFAGTVVRLDISSGKYETVIQHPSTAFAPMLGINGIKVLHATNPPKVFYTNTQLNTVFSAPINPHTGKLVGEVVAVAEHENGPDDLAVTDDGTVLFVKTYAGTLSKAKMGEKVELVAGTEGSSVLQGATSVTLGRTYKDRNVAYVATMGGFNANGSFVEGGKIVALEFGGKAQNAEKKDQEAREL